MLWKLFNTYFSTKISSFQLQLRMKSLNYVLELKCSQNIWTHTPVLGTSLVTDMKWIAKKLDTNIQNQEVLVLKCQYIWMNPRKWVKYCFLSGVIAVLKNSFHNALKNWMLWKCYECYEECWKPLNVGVLKNSGPALQSEIFCLTAIIVAWLYATITALRQNISLWSAGPENGNTFEWILKNV